MEKVGTNLFFQHGGRVDMTRGGSMPNTGAAQSGSDWHPAWLTDQEFVVKEQSASKNLAALTAANANPDVRLRAEHMAMGGTFNPIAGALRQLNEWTSTPGRPGRPAPGGMGPPAPGVVGTPGIVPEEIVSAAELAGGPVGQVVALAAYMVGQAQKQFHDAVVGVVGDLGAFASALGGPKADPAQMFAGAGAAITAGGEKVSDVINKGINPLGAALGLDLIPQVKLMTGVAGEASKQFGNLITAVQATAERYGEFSPDVAVVQAMVEVQHTMGELRRAQEAGPELARYLRVQGDLQQRAEDIKIKLLTKLLPMVTLIVSFAEKAVQGGESIADVLAALLSPVSAAAEAIGRLAGAQEDANRPVVGDPTETLFQFPGALQGQGVGVPEA